MVDEKSLVRASPGTTMLIDRTNIVPYKDLKNAWQFIAVQDDLDESEFDREITTIWVCFHSPGLRGGISWAWAI